MARVELKNLRKDWGGANAVSGLDLRIEDGAFLAVLAASYPAFRAMKSL